MNAQLVEQGEIIDTYICGCGNTFTKPVRHRYDMRPKCCINCNVKNRGNYNINKPKERTVVRPFTDSEQDMIRRYNVRASK